MAEVLIVGGGRIGTYLANLLFESGRKFTLIESDPARVHRLRQLLPPAQVVLGTGTHPHVLESAGLSRASLARPPP